MRRPRFPMLHQIIITFLGFDAYVETIMFGLSAV
jgi:hypothetical protein